MTFEYFSIIKMADLISNKGSFNTRRVNTVCLFHLCNDLFRIYVGFVIECAHVYLVFSDISGFLIESVTRVFNFKCT